MLYIGRASEILKLETLHEENIHIIQGVAPSDLSLLWFTHACQLKIDGEGYFFEANQVICLTEFHKIEVVKLKGARLIRFNRSFYCIKDHDDEVSCRGLLFYGASQVPIIGIPEKEIEKFEILWRVFSIEMITEDNLQQEMLQMMLKRLIILCTRLFKEQQSSYEIPSNNLDIIHEFNYLVEVHFRSKHTVSEYAELLNKSPKTLSNLFAQYSQKTPLQIIQERIVLEAKRLLWYTDKPVKEITFEIGYSDIQSFSRLFRSKEGMGPREFRNKKLGKENLSTH